MLERLSDDYEHVANYSVSSDEFVQKAVDSAEFHKRHGARAEYRKDAYIVKHFRNRNVSEYHSTKWTEYFFGYDFLSLLVIIILILGLSSAFCGFYFRFTI